MLSVRLNAFSDNLQRLSDSVSQEAVAVRLKARRMRGFSRPAVNLPTEILANIFTLACFSPPWSTTGEPFERIARSVASNRTSIALTCRHWRDVTASTKALWRMVSLTEESPGYSFRGNEDNDGGNNNNNNSRVNVDSVQATGFPNRLSRVRMRVELSGNAPLGQSTISFLSSALARAEYLYYNSEYYEPSEGINPLFDEPPIEFPWLRKLAVSFANDPYTLDLRCAPRLEHLKYNSNYEEDQVLLAVDCQLRSVTLQGSMHPIYVCGLLRSCPLLETLHLDVVIPPDALTNPPVFPSLRRLFLYDFWAGEDNEIPLWLIQAPKLESLALMFVGQDFVGPLVQHRPSVRYLSIYVDEPVRDQMHHLWALLESCGAITRLALSYSGDVGLFRAWLSDLFQSSTMFPNLEYFETSFYLDDVDKLHPDVLDLRPNVTLILPKDVSSHQYLEAFPAYASRMKISEDRDFPALSQYIRSWEETEEGWCD